MTCDVGRRISRRAWMTSATAGLLLAATGCTEKAPLYGVEHPSRLPGIRQQTWAVAPTLNLSGEKSVDPILSADLLYQQVQQFDGVRAIPVNRVAEIYTAMKLKNGVQSTAQATAVCDLLGCDGLLVPTFTIYDPYDPPKLGASLQLFIRPQTMAHPAMAVLNPHELERSTTTPTTRVVKPGGGLAQAVGMYDAANGSVRNALFYYAQGRNDPQGPFGAREYVVSMDRYTGFVFHVLLVDLVNSAGYRRISG